MRSSDATGRTRRRGRGWLIVLAVVIVLSGVLSLFRQAVGRFLLDRTLTVLARSTGARVEYERLSGDVYATPRFENVTVVFNGDSIKAQELVFSYDPFGFLRGRIPISEVDIIRPHLFLSTRQPVPSDSGKEEAAVPEFPRLSLKQLRITGGVLEYDGVPRVDSLDLVLSLESGPEEVGARLRSASGRLVQEEIAVKDISAGCRLTGDSLVLSDLMVFTRSSRVEGSFQLALDGTGMKAQVDELSVNLSEFFDVPGFVRANGSAGIQNGVRSGELNYVAEGLRLAGVELPAFKGKLVLDDPDLRVEAAGGDIATGSLRLSGSLNIERLSYHGEAFLRQVAANRFRPDVPVAAFDADVKFRGWGIDSILVELEARVPELGIDSLTASGGFRAGAVSIDGLELRGPSGWLWLSGSYHDGLVQAECVLDSFDIGPAGRLAGMEAGGRLSGLLRVARNRDSLYAAGGLRAYGLSLSGAKVERAIAEFDLGIGERISGRLVVGGEEIRAGGFELDAAQLVLLDSDFDLRIDRPEDRLVALGTVGFLSRTGAECEVSTFQFTARDETLSAPRAFGVRWNRDSLMLSGARYELADGFVELELTRVGSGLPLVDARARGLNLRKLQKLFGIPFELSGTFDFDLAGRDSFDLKLVGTDLEVTGIGMRLKKLGAELTFTESWSSIDDCWFVHVLDTTRVQGRVNYDLADGFRLDDVDVEADIADPGPWVLSFLKEILDLQQGEVYGKLALRGGLTEPNLDGRVRLVRGTILVPALNTLVEGVNAELTARGNRITLDKLSGGAGKGIVTAAGFVDLGRNWLVDTLHYRIRPDGAAIIPLPEVYAVVGGDICLDWAPGRPFSIAGTIDVEEALLAFNFGQTTAPAAEEDTAALAYDIRIRGDRDIWLRNRMVDIELSVDLHLLRTATGETFSGQLASRQGDIYYLDHTLRVSRGVIAFDNISRLNPSLDIVAELPVRSVVQTEEDLPDKVLLTLSGTLEKPEFRFGSEPAGWDETEIITYLSLNVTTQELSALENREMMTKYLSERFLGYLQTQGTKWARKYVGLDELRFESEFAGGEGNRVTVGKYVGRDLYVTYTQNFTGELQPEFTVEYYLNRRNEIVGGRSADGRYSVRYRYKLRY